MTENKYFEDLSMDAKFDKLGLRFRFNTHAPKGSMSFWDNENKTILNVTETLDVLNKLYQENTKIKEILFNKRKELNDAYNNAVKAGMPTGGVIGELDLVEEILEEMGWNND